MRMLEKCRNNNDNNNNNNSDDPLTSRPTDGVKNPDPLIQEGEIDRVFL